MKQSDDTKAFFEKYGFTCSMTKTHPEFKDQMQFEGLEANYVQSLEREVVELRKYIQMQNEKLDFLRDREFHAWKAGKKNEQ